MHLLLARLNLVVTGDVLGINGYIGVIGLSAHHIVFRHACPGSLIHILDGVAQVRALDIVEGHRLVVCIDGNFHGGSAGMHVAFNVGRSLRYRRLERLAVHGLFRVHGRIRALLQVADGVSHVRALGVVEGRNVFTFLDLDVLRSAYNQVVSEDRFGRNAYRVAKGLLAFVLGLQQLLRILIHMADNQRRLDVCGRAAARSGVLRKCPGNTHGHDHGECQQHAQQTLQFHVSFLPVFLKTIYVKTVACPHLPLFPAQVQALRRCLRGCNGHCFPSCLPQASVSRNMLYRAAQYASL